MIGALDYFALLGVANNAAYLRDIIASEAFQKARLSTNFIEEFFPRWRPGDDEIKAALVAVAAGLDATGQSPAPSTRAGVSPWDRMRGFELWRPTR